MLIAARYLVSSYFLFSRIPYLQRPVHGANTTATFSSFNRHLFIEHPAVVYGKGGG